MCVCVCACKCVCVCVFVCMCMCECVCAFVCMFACLYAYMCVTFGLFFVSCPGMQINPPHPPSSSSSSSHPPPPPPPPPIGEHSKWMWVCWDESEVGSWRRENIIIHTYLTAPLLRRARQISLHLFWGFHSSYISLGLHMRKKRATANLWMHIGQP